MHLTEEQLNEYLDHEIEDRAQVEAHLGTCAECAARLAALQALFAEIESLPEEAWSRAPAWRAAPIARPVSAAGILPRWLTLTAGLQASAALIAMLLAAPILIEFASASLPIPQWPSLSAYVFLIRTQWTAWLDALSQVSMPAMPELPSSMEISGLYFMLVLAGTAVFWIVGNGILLRNQIK